MKEFLVNKYKILLLIFYFGMCGFLNAQSLFLQENFDFTAGTDLNGQNNWIVGSASTNRISVSATGLVYSGYPFSGTGNAATFIPTTDRLQKTFVGTLSGTYYYSALINLTSAGSGDYFIGFYTNSAFRGRTYIKADGTGFQFGLTKTTTGTVIYTSGVPYSFGTTYLIVVKYEFQTASGTDDKVSLFVNPDLNAIDPGTPIIGPLADAGNDVSANVIAIQGRANSGNFSLDGIRVASDWISLKSETINNHFIEVPKFISSHMVLQRETPLKFHGGGTAGDTVKVVFTRQGNVYKDSVKVDVNGRWSLEIPAQSVCSEPCTLSFGILNNAASLQIFDDILIGDVWFAAGQSNMEKKVSHLLEASQYIAEASNYPMIRSFRASYFSNNFEQERVNGSSVSWFVCNSTEVGEKVSAVAYVFARMLNAELNIPVGIMQSYRGGTELETWMSHGKIISDPELCKVAGRITGMDSTDVAAYPSIHYNGQINPLKGFPIKGFVYYQGESNIKRAKEYRLMMKKLIEDWRSQWGMGNLPFYYVQMPNMGVSVSREYEEGNWQDLREQQQFLLTDDNVPNIGMAVTIDTNEDPNNPDDAIRMHPHNKKPVGERLAQVVLKKTYNKDIIGESPVLSQYWFSRDTAYLVFRNQGAGLKIKTGDTSLNGFVIAGNDKIFKSGNATIINDSTISIQSNLVIQPVAVRYAWSKNPLCNLYNSIDFPASPFRTDIWPSGYTYSTLVSTCASDNNANLISIRVNGVQLSGFNPDIQNYNFKSDELQQVVAITSSPFATITVEQATEQNGRKAIVSVTAEDRTLKLYEIVFNNLTNHPVVKDNDVHVSVQNKDLIIFSRNENSVSFGIYNSMGQCIMWQKLQPNSNTKYTFTNPGLYFAHLNTTKAESSFKFLIK